MKLKTLNRQTFQYRKQNVQCDYILKIYIGWDFWLWQSEKVDKFSPPKIKYQTEQNDKNNFRVWEIKQRERTN